MGGMIETYQCTDCDKSYASMPNLRRHQKLYCNKEPLYQCHACHHKFYQKSNLYKHLFRCRF